MSTIPPCSRAAVLSEAGSIAEALAVEVLLARAARPPTLEVEAMPIEHDSTLL
jgi:hypothetical protein